MAHRSNLSPDGKSVLVVEMDRNLWIPCRLVSTDGSFASRPVGPPGACTFGAWSPDGRWMYFSADAGAGYHIWRQRFPDGKPEQITSGPTEEEGLAMSADGRSLVTSVGLRQRSVWLHDVPGERQVSLEGYAYWPRFSADGRELYYRIRKGATIAFGPSELWMADLESGRNEPLLVGLVVTGYDISSDDRFVASVLESDAKTRLWLGWLDHRSPPQQVPDSEGDNPWFGAAGNILFRASEGGASFLFRIQRDGTGRQKVTSQQVQEVHSVSPDGQWVTAKATLSPTQGIGTQAFPTGGGTPVPIYNANSRARWTRDGKSFYLSIPSAEMAAFAYGRTYVLPVQRGSGLPDLPPGGFRSEAEVAAVPGVGVIEYGDVALGPRPSVYAFSRETVQRNLYRIPLP